MKIFLAVLLCASANVAQWVDTGARFENKPAKSQEYGKFWDESRKEIPRFKKRDLDYGQMLGEHEENEYYEKQCKENEDKKAGKGRIKIH